MNRIEKQVTTITTMDTDTVYQTIDFAIKHLERLQSEDSINLHFLELLRNEIFIQLPKMKEPTRFGTKVHAKYILSNEEWYVGEFIRTTPSIEAGKWMSELGHVVRWQQLTDVKETWT